MGTEEKLRNRISLLLATPQERIFKKQNLTEDNEIRIAALKNKFKGERCFIVGTSPSINQLDLAKLNDEYTFTVNRGYMLKEKGLKHSTFHIISDINTFKDKNSKFELLNDFCDNLFCYAGMKPPVEVKTYYFDYIQSELSDGVIFQPDITKPLIAYQSVIHFGIQMAYYLGFKNIYLIGVDLDFLKNSGHAYNQTEGEKEREKSASIVNAQKMLSGIANCGQWLKENNVKLINASPSGIVDCTERVKYEDLF